MWKRELENYKCDHGDVMTEELDLDSLPEDIQDLVLSGDMTEKEVLDWLKVEASVESCLRCDLGHLCLHKVFGEGSPKAPFFFVGEAPGEKEDVTGKPFIGKSGILLRKSMYEAGFRKGDVFLSNVLKCRPPKQRQPTQKEVGECFMHLWYQLETIKPKVIVGVGSVALNAFITKPKRAIGSCRGDFLSAYGYKFMAVWHPSYVLRSYQKLRRIELAKDLKKAFALVYPDGRPETND